MLTYEDSGVNKEEGYKTVQNIKDFVAETHNENVLSGLGSFGAFFELKNYENPVLVSGTDGVGTKIMIALEAEKYDSIGIDCFAMCANDILCHGAKPLFFLDYMACGKLDANVAAEIVKGMAKACKDTGTALVGGETAEMPGMYKSGDYDVAGFCVGVVEKNQVINGSKIKEGDKIIALPSSGIHSNGFSLVRKVFPNIEEEFNGKKLYKELLIPTELYINPVLSLIKNKVTLNGIAHITGGGLYENVPRIIPNGLTAQINVNQIKVLPIFDEIQKRGKIETKEMYSTFNMGVGMILVLPETSFSSALEHLESSGTEAYEIGEITSSSQPLKMIF